jgi:hypothetical protein
MDLHQIRALELETEQMERFKETAPEMQKHFFDDFEIGIAHEIARYRRLSRTYSVNYH